VCSGARGADECSVFDDFSCFVMPGLDPGI
jgi:hypothetical protein